MSGSTCRRGCARKPPPQYAAAGTVPSTHTSYGVVAIPQTRPARSQRARRPCPGLVTGRAPAPAARLPSATLAQLPTAGTPPRRPPPARNRRAFCTPITVRYLRNRSVSHSPLRRPLIIEFADGNDCGIKPMPTAQMGVERPCRLDLRNQCVCWHRPQSQPRFQRRRGRELRLPGRRRSCLWAREHPRRARPRLGQTARRQHPPSCCRCEIRVCSRDARRSADGGDQGNCQRIVALGRPTPAAHVRHATQAAC